MPEKRMECFRLLFDHLAWIEHQFLSGIRDLRKARSLWGMGGVRKSIHQRVRVTMLRFLGSSGRDSVGRSQHSSNRVSDISTRTMHRSTTPSLSDYLTKIGIKTVPHPPYSPDLAPCDFCLFPKLRGYRYETIEEMKEAVTKLIDTLTQEDFHGAFRKVLERHKQVHCSRRRLLRRGLEFHVCTLNKSTHMKKVWKFI